MMSKSFEHYILTIFNVQIHWRILGLGRAPIHLPSSQWMGHRFGLFDKYCFPSILNQVNQNFKWVVLFDKSTKSEFRSRIKDYQNAMPNFIPIFTEGKFKHGHKYNHFKQVLQELTHDPEYLITTRLDCDDALHENFIDIVQKEFNGKNCVLTPDRGYLFLEDKENGQYKYKCYESKRWIYPRSVFVTTITKINRTVSNTRNCYTNHHSFYKKNFTRKYGNDPLYLLIVHDRNLSNRTILYNCFQRIKHLDKNGVEDLVKNFSIKIQPKTLLL
jgi:hypothetical protein